MPSDPRMNWLDPWANPQCLRCGRFMKVVGHEGEHLDGEPIWRCLNPAHKAGGSEP